MEGINSDSGYNSNSVARTLKNTAFVKNDSLSEAVNSSENKSGSIIAKLSDLSEISRDTMNSSPEIRPEAISRAAALLEDPNWLNDNNLEELAEKLIDIEQL